MRPVLGYLCLAAVFFASARTGQSATYYVDFAGGADTSAGDSPTAAFKHSPGDPEAKEKAAAVKLQPGDRVVFKGGVVYRGCVALQQSGTEGKPIVFDGNGPEKFGAGRAIVDGSDPLTGWKKCASAEEADGNPNWKSIWWTEVPDALASPDQVNLLEDDKPLDLAQDPRPQNPWWPDPIKDYYRFEPNQVTSASLEDAAHLTQAGAHAWDGGYVSGFVGGGGWYYIQKVAGFDPAAHKITFAKFDSIVNMRQYAMLNAVAILNYPGQYVVRSDGKTTKIYLWPVKKEGEPAGVNMTRRPFGFNVNGQSYVTVEGFVVRRLVARSEVNLAPICDGESKPNPGVVIRGNVVTDCCRDRFAASKIGVVCVSSQKGSLVERNELHDNRGCGGVLVDGGKSGAFAAGHVVKDNVIYRNGGIGVRLWVNVKDCKIIGNEIRDTMTDATSPHAPVGILVWTGCTGTLIHSNVVKNNGQSPLYLTQSYDVTVSCNVFIHNGGDIINGGAKDIRLWHNVIINAEANSTRVRAYTNSDGITKNNIIVCNGNKPAPGATFKMDDKHNLCTDLANLGAIFADPAHGDYRLKKGSPAIGAGEATGIERDAAGTPFPKDKAPDVGAYVYTEK